MDKEKNVDFKCRICGCSEYKENIVNSTRVLGSPGKYLERLYCYCENCSVIFRDPEKFSVKK